MHCYTLQELVCMKAPGATPAASIIQDEPGWLDLADYTDLVLWTQFTSVNSLANIQFQTSPTKDAFFWQIMATITSPTATTTVTQVLLWSASVPLARYVRWVLNGTTNVAFDATFRVMVAASAEALAG